MPTGPHPERSLIQVALVEDDLDFQRALAAAIGPEPDLTLHGLATTRAEGLRLLEGPPVDVLLVDLG